MFICFWERNVFYYWFRCWLIIDFQCVECSMLCSWFPLDLELFLCVFKPSFHDLLYPRCFGLDAHITGVLPEFMASTTHNYDRIDVKMLVYTTRSCNYLTSKIGCKPRVLDIKFYLDFPRYFVPGFTFTFDLKVCGNRTRDFYVLVTSNFTSSLDVEPVRLLFTSTRRNSKSNGHKLIVPSVWVMYSLQLVVYIQY